MNEDGLKSLMAAICIQAANDYKISLHGKFVDGVWCLKRGGQWRASSYAGIDPPTEYVRFFHSEWFKALSGMENTEYILKYLRATRDDKRYDGGI